MTDYSPKAFELVREAIKTAGTTEISKVALALEDNMEKTASALVKVRGKKGIRENTLVYEIFRRLNMVGIITTEDLRKVIEMVIKC